MRIEGNVEYCVETLVRAVAVQILELFGLKEEQVLA